MICNFKYICQTFKNKFMKKHEILAINEMRELLKITTVSERLVQLNRHLIHSKIFTTQYMKTYQMRVKDKVLLSALDMNDLKSKIEDLHRSINKLPAIDPKQFDFLDEINKAI